ncbi:MAG TPA: DUF502 domain-containing protein [Kiritimatiellia bacterium]|nr:DUF502 domain-containing protein [Kiritimatiellia bacterium]HPS06174.1 DUF502 domain-containing protein [Kiritimatiellia bacterium]
MKTSEKGPSSRIGKHLRNRLMSGLLVLIPLAITLFILNLLFSTLTAFARPVLRPWTGELPEYILTLIALLVTAVLIYLVGGITTHIIGRRLIHWGEAVLLRLPIVKSIYASSKQVVETFSSSTTAAFQAVVLVEFPRRDALALGFVTGTILNPQGRTFYRIFVATTPNPTSGFLLLLPRDAVQFTDISVEDGIKMIVSGGMLAPPSYQVRPQENTPEQAAAQA